LTAVNAGVVHFSAPIYSAMNILKPVVLLAAYFFEVNTNFFFSLEASWITCKAAQRNAIT
jgi:hypothetical protein